MFQTHSFQAFNLSSHANIKCSLKYSSSDSSLSSLTIEYFFGITEKRQLTILENTLSYDMAFVMGNLKGFYEYLRSIHEESKFQFCELTKDEMKVFFLLKVFNQDRTISQNFISLPINDQVMWKSELKTKLENLQFTMSNRMEREIDRKVRHYVSEEKERGFLKSQAIQEKVSRQLSLMKDKLDLVVKFINSQGIVKEKLEFNEIKYRGRYNQEKEQKNSSSFSNEDDSKRMTRSNDFSRKTKQIQKDEKPPQQVENRKRGGIPRELKNISLHTRNYPARTEKYEKQSAAQKIEQWERQYERLNISSNPKVYPTSEKTQNNRFITQTIPAQGQKRSRGRPRVFRANDSKNHSIRPVQEPFIIEKFKKGEQNQFVQQNTRITGKKLCERPASIVIMPNISEEKRMKLSRERAEDQIRYRRNSQEAKSKPMEVENDKINKGKQVAKSLQLALKSFDPNKNSDQRQNQSAKKKNTQKEKMVDQKDERLENKYLEKEERKFSPQHQPNFKSSDLQNQQQERSLFNRRIYRKNSKPQELIDLEDEQEYKKFIIKISSKNIPEKQESVDKIDKQVMKFQDQGQTNLKNSSEKRKQKNSPNKQVQLVYQRINRMTAPTHYMGSMYNQESDSESEKELNQVDRLIQNFKRNKIEERKEEYQSKIQIPVQFSGQKSVQSQFEQRDMKENASQNNSNMKMFTTPNSKASLESLHEMVDPEKEPDISSIPLAQVPNYQFLNSVNHIIPDFTPCQNVFKISGTKLENYFQFSNQQNQTITKLSKVSVRGKNKYIPLISKEAFPRFGKHFWCMRILKSANYHICMGIVDMPSEIKLGQIPKNCDALYVLDGGLHDEKGGDKTQNGWRVKEGQPVDVLQMELWVEKGEMYVIMAVDMDKEEISFYYNDRFISSTKFSTWCRKNKKKLHAYLAMRSDKDCIEVV